MCMFVLKHIHSLHIDRTPYFELIAHHIYLEHVFPLRSIELGLWREVEKSLYEYTLCTHNDYKNICKYVLLVCLVYYSCESMNLISFELIKET